MLSARVRCAWAAGEQGDLVSRLRAVIGAKDEQIAALTASLEAALARLERRLRRAASRERDAGWAAVAELERRLSMDSTDSARPARRSRSGRKRTAGTAAIRAGAQQDRRGAASLVTRGKA